MKVTENPAESSALPIAMSNSSSSKICWLDGDSLQFKFSSSFVSSRIVGFHSFYIVITMSGLAIQANEPQFGTLITSKLIISNQIDRHLRGSLSS